MAVKKKAVAKKAAKKAPPAKKTAAKKAAAQKTKAAARDLLDLGAFPAEAVSRDTRWLCLACILDLFTRQLGLAAAKAQTEIKRYLPSVEELSAGALVRPYFRAAAEGCPYCGAPAKWHAPLTVVRIEGNKATDAARRNLTKDLPEDQFYITEAKATQRDALFDWLAKTGTALDPDSPGWLLESAHHWLGRRLPKEDWAAIFQEVQAIRRSRRIEEGFEAENGRLYLAPHLFDEILLAQYLLSRSHKHGGLTFEGRMTLQDLYLRLRGGGYLRRAGIMASNASDALEQLIELLGGEGGMKYYYVLDRRAFLDRLKDLKDARIPKPKAAAI